MRAVTFAGEGRVEVDDVPEPHVTKPDEAVVKVTKTAICASDLHLLHGKTPGMRVGGVIGHEFVGVVTEAGSEVVGIEDGDRVLGSFLIACGECPQCAQRRFNFCRNRRALGLGALTGDLDGAQAEYVKVPTASLNLKALTGAIDLDDEHALFAGDILATGFYAASISGIAAGDSAVVIGAGPVGLCSAMALRRLQPQHLLILDTDPARCSFARTLGFDAIDVSDADPQIEVAGATEGKMADAAIDAVGAVPAVKTAMKCVRDGGRVAVVGVYGIERYELPMGMAWIRGIDLRFSGMANVQAEWDEALGAIAAGQLDPTTVITHRLSLEQAVEGYEVFAAREAMKVVLTP